MANVNLADKPLALAGYRYKGEYNIPMRKLYSKKLDYKVNLHVYEHGNPEIELNLTFRDYLIKNKEAREEYAALKKMILKKDNSHKKLVATGVTTYNLGKNDFIQRILKKAGFDGLCTRLCTQDIEWKFYYEIREKLSKTKKIPEVDLEDSTQKNLVLYKGTNIVAAAQLRLNNTSGFLEFLGSNVSDSIKYESHLLKTIEKWLKKQGIMIFRKQT